MDACYMERWNGCCCNCANHLKDMSHPSTDGGSIMQQRGWICAAPDLGGMFSGWTEHGMCEMYQRKKMHVSIITSQPVEIENTASALIENGK